MLKVGQEYDSERAHVNAGKPVRKACAPSGRKACWSRHGNRDVLCVIERQSGSAVARRSRSARYACMRDERGGGGVRSDVWLWGHVREHRAQANVRVGCVSAFSGHSPVTSRASG